MVQGIVKLFIKNYEDIQSEEVRKRYGFLSSIIGIILNLLLFALKYGMGVLSGSVSIISDAFNNLADSGSCVLTLFGYKMAAKSADKDHPFGHGRMEYLISLSVAAIIMVVGFELLKTSVQKIITPEKITFSYIVLGSLLLSIAVKFWLSYFNKSLGKRIHSTVMIATATDSANDVIATLATVVALVASLFTKLPVDGIMGCVVSIFILASGYGMIKDTVDLLLGKPADKEIIDQLKAILHESSITMGLHDIIIHSYGPGVTFGSVHVEVDSLGDIMSIHDAIDELEKKVYEQLHVILTVHMDPVEADNQKLNEAKVMLGEILSQIDESLSFHDLRIVAGPTHTNLIFDIVVPFQSKLSEDKIKEALNRKLAEKETVYYAVVNIDREFT